MRHAGVRPCDYAGRQTDGVAQGGPAGWWLPGLYGGQVQGNRHPRAPGGGGVGVRHLPGAALEKGLVYVTYVFLSRILTHTHTHTHKHTRAALYSRGGAGQDVNSADRGTHARG